MPISCIVKGCKSKKENGFRFPLNRPEALKRWIIALEKHQKLPPNYKDKLICAEHFTENDYLKTKGKTNCLNRKAVPSIFPEIENNTVSDDDKMEEISKSNVKSESNVSNISKNHGRNLRKRPRINVVEPESDEEMASDCDPVADSDEDFSGVESERIRTDDIEDESRDNFRISSRNSESNVETKSVDTFVEISNDEAIDSDYEPVTESSLEILQNLFMKKTEILTKESSTLRCMEEMIKNQSTTIKKLEEELANILKTENEEKSNENSELDSTSNGRQMTAANVSNGKVFDYSNLDLQLFAISLFYFSPKVYAYLGSIMPYLPPKKLVVDWVQSGHAFTLFPPGVLVKENFILD